MNRGILLVVGLLLVGACGTPAAAEQLPHPPAVVAPSPAPLPAPTTKRAPVPVAQQVEVTFYGAPDNDPPGSAEIAHPNSRHAVAGGTGTYADPLTLATDPREIRPGVVVYYATVKKYFVMEDDCAPCIEEWSAGKHPHVDLWTSGTTNPAVIACEEALTPDAVGTIVVNAPPGLPVDARPLYDDAGRCWPATS